MMPTADNRTRPSHSFRFKEANSENMQTARQGLHRRVASHRTVKSNSACLPAELVVLKDQHASVMEKRGSKKKLTVLGEMRGRVVRMEAQGGRRGREAWAKTEADNVLSKSQTSRIINLLRSTQSSSPTQAHNLSAKTLRPAGSCCLRLRTCTQPFQVFNERSRTYALLIRPLAFNQCLNMQKLFSNDTCGSPTLLYANAVPLARSLRDRCPAIDASSSEVYTFKTEDSPLTVIFTVAFCRLSPTTAKVHQLVPPPMYPAAVENLCYVPL